MDAQHIPLEGGAQGAPRLDGQLPSLDRLALRPWESATAMQRLSVPHRLLPDYCTVTTNWVVFTGTSCAGKTTTIRAFQRLGFQVQHEGSRGYVEDEMEKGREIRDIRADDHEFRMQVLSRTVDAEIALMPRAAEVIFLDRSATDSISVHRGSGYDPHEVLQQLRSYRYARIFHFTPLPFEDDGFRTVNEERRRFLDAALERDYRALCYQPVRVPYMSVDERVQFILENLGINGH